MMDQDETPRHQIQSLSARFSGRDNLAIKFEFRHRILRAGASRLPCGRTARGDIGHVGTGFSHQTLEELLGKLVKLKAATSPFSDKVKDQAVTTWVRPSLVAEHAVLHPHHHVYPSDRASGFVYAPRKHSRSADPCNKPEPYFGACQGYAPGEKERFLESVLNPY